MRELFEQLVAARQAGRELAYCRLVETRGSTPQKAGAMMLVFADGSQAGTLGGGCVEAEVKRQAFSVMQRGGAEIASFQLDSDYGWDDGLICGGRMRVLIQPVGQTAPNAAGQGAAEEYFQRAAELAASGAGFTEAILFDGEASGLPTPASYLIDAQGQPLAALRPAAAPIASPDALALPPLVEQALRPLNERPRPYVARGVAYLPLLPRCRLVIVGGGHVGQAVGSLAAELDFDVWVIDDRAEIVSAARFPNAQRRLAGSIPELLAGLEIAPSDYCLIVTRGHNHDEEALYHLADRGAAYVGMIGSKRKIRLIFDDLLAEGISPEAISRVHAPVGLDIGSQTVPEIAVSICAELVAHRNRDYRRAKVAHDAEVECDA